MANGIARVWANAFARVIYTSFAITTLVVLCLMVLAACGVFLWALRRDDF
jgi:hypothetical protein